VTQAFTLTVNGAAHRVSISPEASLLTLLRDTLGLRGSKLGCGVGECGACTVLVEGRAICACLLPATRAAGLHVETIEGLGTQGDLHPVQRAFLDHGALQCGFCTPGMVMSAIGLLRHNPAPSDDEIGEALQGNICRCTGYMKILEAVRAAARGIRA
jgi:carbon-monoxide dehydrogenase small subunit